MPELTTILAGEPEEVKIDEPEIVDAEIKTEPEKALEEKPESESSEESLLEVDRLLSGFNREFKDLVKSIKDPELQKKALEAGKVSRAREDRVASELGDLKKQHDIVANFKQMLDADPKNTILQIAKMANLDLRSLVEPTAAEEDDDYLLPEEKALKTKMKNIEQQNLLLAKKLEAMEQREQREQQEIIAEVVESYHSNKEKFPFAEEALGKVKELLEIENLRFGLPKNRQEMDSRLEKAYKNAILLDDNLLQKRDAELVLKLDAKRKADVEKAKNQKKVSTTYANNSTRPATLKDELIAEYKRMGL